MSKEVELLGKQSLELSGLGASSGEPKIGWSAVVTGWLHRWKAREGGSVYASYAEALRQEIELINYRRELLLEQNDQHQRNKSMAAAAKIIDELEELGEKIQTRRKRQEKMEKEHEAFLQQCEIEKNERRRKALNPNQLLQDDLRILNRQILDLDKDTELDQESRSELLEILLMQKRKLFETAKGAI